MRRKSVKMGAIPHMVCRAARDATYGPAIGVYGMSFATGIAVDRWERSTIRKSGASRPLAASVQKV